MKCHRGLAALAAGGLLVGCATFRGGSARDPASWPPAASGRPLTVLVDVPRPSGDQPVPFSAAFRQGIADCIPTLRGSRLFAKVGGKIDDPDLYVTGDATHEETPYVGGAVLSGLTFLLVPAPVGKARWSLRARVMNARSHAAKEITLDATTHTWFGLFLFPVMPFRFPFVEDPRARDRICRNLAVAVWEAGNEFARTAAGPR